MQQLDLFIWAATRSTAEVIDILPALCRKAAFDVIYRIPPPKEAGKVIPMRGRAA
jgi:hypothetical protein